MVGEGETVVAEEEEEDGVVVGVVEETEASPPEDAEASHLVAEDEGVVTEEVPEGVAAEEAVAVEAEVRLDTDIISGSDEQE